MPEQHRDLLDRLYEAFNRRDMPGMLDCFDRDIEVSAPEGLEYASLMVHLLGRRGSWCCWTSIAGTTRSGASTRRCGRISDPFLVDAEEFVEQGDAVVVPVVIRARSADGGQREGGPRRAPLDHGRGQGRQPADLR